MKSTTTSTVSGQPLVLPHIVPDANTGVGDCYQDKEKTRNKCVNYPSVTHSTMHLRALDISFLVSAFLRYGCLTLIPENLAQPLFLDVSSFNKSIKSNFKFTKILPWN